MSCGASAGGTGASPSALAALRAFVAGVSVACICILTVVKSLPCIDKGDGVSYDAMLYVVLSVAVCPNGRSQCAFHKHHTTLGEVFSQTDMVLLAALHPYPSGDLLALTVVVHCDVNSHECSVCTCDDAAILCSDASDSVNM